VDEVELSGGVANAGAVVRVGPHVLRPSNPSSPSIHRFLSALRDAGFDGVPEPVGIDADGRERLVFIEGDVPLPPYPDWARSNGAIVSIAGLLRRMHDAAASIGPSVPAPTDDVNAVRFGWTPDELHAAPARVRLVCDAYGLDAEDRRVLVDIVSEGMALVGRFVRRRMEAGDPNFTRMWHDLGGAERFERRHRWWIEHRADFEAALA
jgi:hypothetical protein